jgi:P-type Mg2+ transporter
MRQFESPLVLILVFAAAISLVLSELLDAAIILAIVLGSSLLGFFQESGLRCPSSGSRAAWH